MRLTLQMRPTLEMRLTLQMLVRAVGSQFRVRVEGLGL